MQPIGQILPRALADVVRQAPLSAGKVDFAWRTAVGSTMARSTAVRLDGRVLLVDAQTMQWGAAVMRSSGIILTRLHRLLGPEAVSEIRLRDRQDVRRQRT